MSRPRLRTFLLPGMTLAVVALTFSDRTPQIVWSVALFLRRAGSRVEATLGIDWVDRSDLPLAKDTFAHLVLWFMIGVIAHVALAHRASARSLIQALLILALGSEVLQPVLSAQRNLEFSDFAANVVGLVVGVGVAVAARRLDRRRTPLPSGI